MAKRILIRRDTSANWQSVNPILSNGEFGIEIKDDGTRSLKLGTGSIPWDSLDYFLNDPATAADLNNEIINRTDADSDLQDSIDTVSTDLATETTNRTNADSDLQSQINILGTDLDTETTDRQSVDSGLQDDIDSLETDLATETTNRTNADDDLQDSIDTLETDLATETTNRTNADSDLQDSIDSLETDLNTEITDRQTAISNAITTAATDATNKANTAESNAKEYADDLALATQKWLPAVQTFDDLPDNPGDGTYLCRVITGDDYGVYQWIGTETTPKWTYFSDNLDFIDRIANPTTDNLPIITANGELKDSGESITDIYTAISTGLATKENTIAAGTSSQYYRGDKTWQTFPTIPAPANEGILILQKNGTDIDTFSANASTDKTINITMAKGDVGLSNVDNTADADKPLSEAMTTALDGKEPSKYIADNEADAIDYSTLNPTIMVFYPEE
jgi:hypothetical protein